MTYLNIYQRPFGNLGIGIAKNLFCLPKSLFLPFEDLHEEKILGGVLFKYIC